MGDEVLAAVAARLLGCVRSGDSVARLGGDEFVVLTFLTHIDAQSVTNRVRQALADPVATSEGPLMVGASVGIAVSEPGSDGDDLLRRADKAMYRDKLARQ